MTFRFDTYPKKLSSIHQNAFIQGRNIIDGALSLHKLMHHYHVKKQMKIILQIDFEKAYEKFNWYFILDYHRAREFS
jgi:hypothetical protein